MSTSQSLRNCKKYFNRYSKLNQLPSYMSQPSQVSLNEHSFSRLHESNISTPSPSVPATSQQGQSVNQLPPVLPKSIIPYKLDIRVSLQQNHQRGCSSDDQVVLEWDLGEFVSISLVSVEVIGNASQ
ncbi:hypothetical protein ACTFIY_001258 [Dictyostelium cf. discoideum]